MLDGGGTLGELLTLRACSGVTIADLTVQNVRWNGIKLDTDTGVQRATIRNCVLHNIWQRAIKGVKVPEAGPRDDPAARTASSSTASSSNDRPKRFEDDPADTRGNFDGNYVGGIDVMYATGWTIRDNVFVGIRGRTGDAPGRGLPLARRAGLRRRAERDRGLRLGHLPRQLVTSRTTSRSTAPGVIVRNNFLCRVPENGILADYTRDCAILHNTVHDPRSRLGRLIRLVHDNDGLRVVNNLLSGPPPRNESGSEITMRGNLSGDLTAAFVAPDEGNLA